MDDSSRMALFAPPPYSNGNTFDNNSLGMGFDELDNLLYMPDSTYAARAPAASKLPTTLPQAKRRKRTASGKGRKAKQEADRELTRERNRLHARNSRMRKKLYIDSLKQSVAALKSENAALRAELELKNLSRGTENGEFGGFGIPSPPLLSREPSNSKNNLSAGDFSLIEALSNSTQNFVISDPKMPDNPIVYASDMFFKLTGYSREEVVGRNCRFLQGPGTDARVIQKIKNAVAKTEDIQVVVKNYRKNGEAFWNRLFIAPLRNCNNMVVNFIAVQTEVSEEFATKIKEVLVKEEAKVNAEEDDDSEPKSQDESASDDDDAAATNVINGQI